MTIGPAELFVNCISNDDLCNDAEHLNLKQKIVYLIIDSLCKDCDTDDKDYEYYAKVENFFYQINHILYFLIDNCWGERPINLQ